MKNSKVYFVMFLGYYGECVCIYVIFYAVHPSRTKAWDVFV